MKRREFITLLGGAAAAWPLAARTQQGNRVRRIGVLMSGDGNDPVSKTSVAAFTQALAGLGWSDGRNVRIVPRWTGGDINRSRALAQELVGLQPNIILTWETVRPLPSSGRRGRSRSYLRAWSIPSPSASSHAPSSRTAHIGVETMYRRSITYLSLPETAVCSPTEPTR